MRQQALRQFGDRKDGSVVSLLLSLLRGPDAQTSLEAIWAIYQSGSWSEEIAIEGMRHNDPYVRMWSVRLTADEGLKNQLLQKELTQLAATESHPR